MTGAALTGAALTALFVLGALSQAGAQGSSDASPPPPGAGLSWVRGETASECFDEAQLKGEVTQRLRRDPFVEVAPQTIEGIVSRDDTGTWRAVLYSRDEHGALIGTRHLHSDAATCSSLMEAVALGIALAIDPEAALQAPSSEAVRETPIAPADDEPGPEPPRDDCPAQVELPDSQRDPVRMRLGATFGWGLVPGTGVGVELVVDAPLVRRLRLRAAMLYVPEHRATGDDSDLGFGLVAPSLGLCFGEFSKRLFFRACVDVAIGAIQAIVHEPLPLAPGDYLFAAIGLDAELGVTIAGPVFIAVSARASAPLIRRQFRVEGREMVSFQQFPVIPRAAIRLGLSFY